MTTDAVIVVPGYCSESFTDADGVDVVCQLREGHDGTHFAREGMVEWRSPRTEA